MLKKVLSGLLLLVLLFCGCFLCSCFLCLVGGFCCFLGFCHRLFGI